MLKKTSGNSPSQIDTAWIAAVKKLEIKNPDSLDGRYPRNNDDNPSVKKININTATVDEMKSHPYIKYSLANPIIAYRNEHGAFSKIEDIRKIMVVTDEIYRKIAPYLTL